MYSFQIYYVRKDKSEDSNLLTLVGLETSFIIKKLVNVLSFILIKILLCIYNKLITSIVVDMII